MRPRSEIIHLGFEVGTGNRVEIPLRHMAVTGQTQEAGKTTALEALVSRMISGTPALAFITKRGEGGFSAANHIPPYFTEGSHGRPYWEYVESIAASAVGEKKLKFERSWIMRACRGANSLADVRAKLGELEAAARKDLDRSMFSMLAAYLDIVIPQIQALQAQRGPGSVGIDLKPGLNVMDLVGWSDEMQMLVVRSALDWIHSKESGVVTVIPEAWKFIPEGRMTPVKPIAEKLIREGAGLKNYVWMDSQDIAGVWKLMLRGAPVWLIGVQRERNEVQRTLDSIPGSVSKPKPADVMTLELGRFYVCWGKHAIHTYVQPAWMGPDKSRSIAMGEQEISTSPRVAAARDVLATMQPVPPHSNPFGNKVSPLDQMVAARHEQANNASTSLANAIIHGDQVVDQKEADALRGENRRLRETVERLEGEIEQLRQKPPTAPAHSTAGSNGQAATVGGLLVGDVESLYQTIKSRLMDEAPLVIAVLAERPEIEVQVQRRKVEIDGSTGRGRLAKLIASGFLKDGKPQADMRKELMRTGSDIGAGNLSNYCKEFVSSGLLINDSGTYTLAPGVKVGTKEIEAVS